MKIRSFRIIFRTIFLLVTTYSLVACSSSGDTFPQVASPPPFDHIDGEELRSGMHQLAFELQRLDSSLATENTEGLISQQDVVDNIRNIERVAENLRFGDLSSKHPFLVDGMDRFLSDVNRALADASRNSPRYYMAGRISGGCINCHNTSR